MAKRKKTTEGEDKTLRTLPCPFGNKPRKRACAGRDEVLAWARYRCCGGLHCVGLMKSGRLVFSHHTLHDLQAGLVLVDMGDTSNQCARIYRDWVLGNGPHGNAIPAELVARRRSWNTWSGDKIYSRSAWSLRHGYRLMERRRRERSLADEKYCPAPLPVASGGGPNHDSASKLRDYVLEGLKKRGWLVSLTTPDNPKRPTISPNGNSLNVTLPSPSMAQKGSCGMSTYVTLGGFYLHGSGYVSVTVNDPGFQTVVGIHDTVKCELGVICDAYEAALFKLILDRRGLIHKQQEMTAFASRLERLTSKLRKEGGIHLSAGCQDAEENKVKLTLEIPELTVQAAQRLAEFLIKEARQTIDAYGLAAKSRLEAVVRTPAPPSQGSGYHKTPRGLKKRLEIRTRKEE